jgi:hypothetical protein
MTEPVRCPCGDHAEPTDPDGLCFFCRCWNGDDAHGPFTLLSLEEAGKQLQQQIDAAS